MCSDYFQKHSLGSRTIDRATVAVTGMISTCYRATGLCMSVTSRCPIETAKRNSWFLAWELPSTSTILCYKEIQVPSKISVRPFWYFARNSSLKKFRRNISIAEACCQLSSRKLDAQSVINLVVVGQQVDRRSDARPLYFTARLVKLCL